MRGQLLCAAVDQRDAEGALETADGGVGGGDAQATPQRHLQSAGDAVTLDCGYRRLGDLSAGEAQPAVGRVLKIRRFAVPGVAEFGRRLAVDCVLAVRAVGCDDCYRPSRS